jgi:hypothetical protein
MAYYIKEKTDLSVFENKVLRRICGAKGKEVTREWRILHIDELHNLQSSLHILKVTKTRKIRMAGHIAQMGKICKE